MATMKAYYWSTASKRAILLAVGLAIGAIFVFYKYFSIAPPYLGPYIAYNDLPEHGLLTSQMANEHCRRRRLEAYQTRDRPRRIYDLFLINTELDWLEIRLEELYKHVDYFVVLEADLSFQGHPKPLHLLDNWKKFEKFHSKIVRRTLNFTDIDFPKGSAWDHEHFARNQLFDLVIAEMDEDQKPQQGDVLIVSDVDEIPRPKTLVTLQNCAFPPRVTLRSSFYYYSFQWLHHGKQWPHPQATFYNGPKDTIKPEDLRKGRIHLDIFNAAWHCSTCLETLEAITDKITSFSHSEFNTPYYLNRSRLLQKIRNGDDIFERRGEKFDRVDDNGDVPKALLSEDGQKQWAYMVDRDPVDGNFRDWDGHE